MPLQSEGGGMSDMSSNSVADNIDGLIGFVLHLIRPEE